MAMMQLRYRPEIDGLRTIAVLAVIIYHAQFTVGKDIFLKGGFLGVDIFFVISGFLITTIIMKELHAGSFSFPNFYERRARRILPALFLVAIISFPIAWCLLLPSQLIDFSKSILSTLIFGSNFYWFDALGQYDAESALLKPFLHTWSLAVEEQYYIIFPVILMVIYRWFKAHTSVLLAIGLVLSLALSDFVTSRDQSLSFYMLPTRFWELLAGSLLAHFLYFQSHNKKHDLLDKTMPILGLSLIVYSLIFTDFENNHPGYITLFPVVGTVLIIYFANEKDLVTRLLSSRLFVGLGLISYSLYLWHYPIFAFGRLVESSPIWFDKSLWLVLTMVLSMGTYFCVEKPFRNKNLINKKTLVISLFSASLALSGMSLAVLMSSGFDSRMPDILKNLETNVMKSRVCEESQNFCSIQAEGSKQIFLVGDSHMMPLEKPMAEFSRSGGYDLTILNVPGCQYILDLNRVTKAGQKLSQCDTELQLQRQQKLLSSPPGIVVIGGRLPLILTEERFDNKEGGVEGEMKDFLQPPDFSLETRSARQQAIMESYKKTITQLVNHGHKVILVYPVPEVGWHVPKSLKRKLNGVPVENLEQYLRESPVTTSTDRYFERTDSSFELLDSINHNNIFRVYPHELFCDTEVEGRCSTHDTKNSFYRDDDHLSEVGAKMLVDKIKQLPVFSKK